MAGKLDAIRSLGDDFASQLPKRRGGRKFLETVIKSRADTLPTAVFAVPLSPASKLKSRESRRHQIDDSRFSGNN